MDVGDEEVDMILVET